MHCINRGDKSHETLGIIVSTVPKHQHSSPCHLNVNSSISYCHKFFSLIRENTHGLWTKTHLLYFKLFLFHYFIGRTRNKTNNWLYVWSIFWSLLWNLKLSWNLCEEMTITWENKRIEIEKMIENNKENIRIWKEKILTKL